MIRVEDWSPEAKRYVFVCDECGTEKPIIGASPEQAAGWAKALGWRAKRGLDHCPACVKEGHGWRG